MARGDTVLIPPGANHVEVSFDRPVGLFQSDSGRGAAVTFSGAVSPAFRVSDRFLPGPFFKEVNTYRLCSQGLIGKVTLFLLETLVAWRSRKP